MKVPIQWMRDYTPIPCAADELASRMIMIGTGVEGVRHMNDELSGVVAGRVLTVRDHENSDHLHVCTVDVGKEEPLQIVCGAPNVREGILVPVALEGANLPGGVHIKRGKLRGVESRGMLCSSTELQVPVELYPSVGDAGLLIFNEDYPVGTDVRPILGIDHDILDFEILANRPDCLSVWGVAREAAVAVDTAFKMPEITVKEADTAPITDSAAVTVLAPELCPRYAARVVRNVRVAPSPMWLRSYLNAAGMRSINNIVDITNFVMLETGHPMHAFDLAKVRGGHILVRAARAGETLRTLDGRDHALAGGEILICDEEGPTGLAGIMGGEESEITEHTEALLFECATFDRAAVRVASRALGVRTESSGRFEKGVSARTIMTALDRACQMINLLDAGDVAPGVIDTCPCPPAQPVITASCKRMQALMGVPVPPEQMIKILRGLRFEAELSGDTITARAPDFRQDVDGEADLAEEVLRVAGYDLIPSTPLRGEAHQGGLNARSKAFYSLRALMSGQSAYEVETFSFVAAKSIEKLGLPEDDPRTHPVTLQNPLGEDTACMRTTLAPSLIEVAARNQNSGNTQGRLYELSRVFDGVNTTDEGLPVERDAMAIILWGDKEDFYTLRAMAQSVLDVSGARYTLARGAEIYHHPGRSATLASPDGTVLCTLGEIHPDTADAFDLKQRTYLAQIDLEALRAHANPQGEIKPLPRTPAVQRDIALCMPETQPLGEVQSAIERKAGALCEQVRLFDVYRGAQLGEGLKSAAFTLTLRAPDRTLTDEEIARVMDGVQAECRKLFGAEVRGV